MLVAEIIFLLKLGGQMFKHNRILLFAMLALILVMVISVGFTHVAYAVGFDTSKGNAGGGWGGLPPTDGGIGADDPDGLDKGPGHAGQPGGIP
jgi:hypothetical protein